MSLISDEEYTRIHSHVEFMIFPDLLQSHCEKLKSGLEKFPGGGDLIRVFLKEANENVSGKEKNAAISSAGVGLGGSNVGSASVGSAGGSAGNGPVGLSNGPVGISNVGFGTGPVGSISVGSVGMRSRKLKQLATKVVTFMNYELEDLEELLSLKYQRQLMNAEIEYGEDQPKLMSRLMKHRWVARFSLKRPPIRLKSLSKLDSFLPSDYEIKESFEFLSKWLNDSVAVEQYPLLHFKILFEIAETNFANSKQNDALTLFKRAHSLLNSNQTLIDQLNIDSHHPKNKHNSLAALKDRLENFLLVLNLLSSNEPQIQTTSLLLDSLLEKINHNTNQANYQDLNGPLNQQIIELLEEDNFCPNLLWSHRFSLENHPNLILIKHKIISLNLLWRLLNTNATPSLVWLNGIDFGLSSDFFLSSIFNCWKRIGCPQDKLERFSQLCNIIFTDLNDSETWEKFFTSNPSFVLAEQLKIRSISASKQHINNNILQMSSLDTEKLNFHHLEVLIHSWKPKHVLQSATLLINQKPSITSSIGSTSMVSIIESIILKRAASYEESGSFEISNQFYVTLIKLHQRYSSNNNLSDKITNETCSQMMMQIDSIENFEDNKKQAEFNDCIDLFSSLNPLNIINDSKIIWGYFISTIHLSKSDKIFDFIQTQIEAFLSNSLIPQTSHLEYLISYLFNLGEFGRLNHVLNTLLTFFNQNVESFYGPLIVLSKVGLILSRFIESCLVIMQRDCPSKIALQDCSEENELRRIYLECPLNLDQLFQIIFKEVSLGIEFEWKSDHGLLRKIENVKFLEIFCSVSALCFEHLYRSAMIPCNIQRDRILPLYSKINLAFDNSWFQVVRSLSLSNEKFVVDFCTQNLQRFFKVNPNSDAACYTLADVHYHKQKYSMSMRYYLLAGSIETSIWSEYVSTQSFMTCLANLIDCLVQDKYYDYAIIVHQYARVVDYSAVFKLIEEFGNAFKKENFKYLWEIPIMEHLVNVFKIKNHMNNAIELIKYISKPEMNVFNSMTSRTKLARDWIKRSFFDMISKRFLQDGNWNGNE